MIHGVNLMKFSWMFVFLFASMLSISAIAQQSDRDRGIDLYRDGKFAEAVTALESSVAANQNDRVAWMFLGGAYLHRDIKDKATGAFGRMSGIKQPAPPPRYDKTVKITYKPRPGYTEEARRNQSSGTIRIVVEFRADGTIGFVFPLLTSSRDLVQPSLRAARDIKFEPAVKDGKPVTVINLIEYGYSMQ